jgi:hypothetical protein
MRWHEKPAPAPGLHVEPTPRGRWVVRYEHGKQPLSDHLTASEAQGVRAMARANRRHRCRAPARQLRAGARDLALGMSARAAHGRRGPRHHPRLRRSGCVNGRRHGGGAAGPAAGERAAQRASSKRREGERPRPRRRLSSLPDRRSAGGYFALVTASLAARQASAGYGQRKHKSRNRTRGEPGGGHLAGFAAGSGGRPYWSTSSSLSASARSSWVGRL